MASPQPDKYTKISNELAEAFFTRRISGREWQIIWVVLRKTWGFREASGDKTKRKKMDAISKTQFAKLTGIPRQKCQELVKRLVKKRVLIEGVTHKGNTWLATYGFNKDYDQWVLPIKVTGTGVTHKGNGVLPIKVIEVLPIKVTTKEKKENIQKKCPNSYESDVSCLLFQLITERRNSFKKPDLKKWAEHIDKMIRIDKRDPREIEDVITWCQQDDFWQNNILSTDKLRKQYDQLALKLQKNLEIKSKNEKPHVSENPRLDVCLVDLICKKCGGSGQHLETCSDYVSVEEIRKFKTRTRNLLDGKGNKKDDQRR